MEKTKDAVKQQLKEQWRQAVRGYQAALLNMWELDAHYGYWIGGEEGSVYDYGDGMFTISIDDMIYCVDCDVTREQYMEWQEYIVDAAEFGFTIPNLRSYLRGCPRTPPEVFEKLRAMKRELDKSVEEAKKANDNHTAESLF